MGTSSILCIPWPCGVLVSLNSPSVEYSPPLFLPPHPRRTLLSPCLPHGASSHLTQAPLEGAISALRAAFEPEEAVPVNNSWGWEALISQAGPTRGPCAGPLSRGSPLYLDAQLVMQPAISQAEGEINFLVLHGRGGGGGVGRCWGAEAGIFPISDSSGLILSQACRKGRKRVLQAKFHHQRQPQQREEEAGANRRKKQGAGAEKGLVWKQGERQPSQPGLTDCSARREKRLGHVGRTCGHICVHTGVLGTRAYLSGKQHQHQGPPHVTCGLAWKREKNKNKKR